MPLADVAKILATEDAAERAVLVHRPVADPPTRGRVRPVTFPPAELAVVVHSGPHDDIDVTYGRLGAWGVDHALVVTALPPRATKARDFDIAHVV